MQRKVALEEHFAIDETLMDSAGFLGENVWAELSNRLMDIQGRRLELMDEHMDDAAHEEGDEHAADDHDAASAHEEEGDHAVDEHVDEEGHTAEADEHSGDEDHEEGDDHDAEAEPVA